MGKADSARNGDLTKGPESAGFKDFWKRFGWGTWIRVYSCLTFSAPPEGSFAFRQPLEIQVLEHEEVDIFHQR
ncbi:MAG: hypothetical protein ACTHOP_09815 [Mesorhizobium sp.]